MQVDLFVEITERAVAFRVECRNIEESQGLINGSAHDHVLNILF